MRRFTRLTNAFSKKFENHMHMVALYTVWYNFVKEHKSLTQGTSPADGCWRPRPSRSDNPFQKATCCAPADWFNASVVEALFLLL